MYDCAIGLNQMPPPTLVCQPPGDAPSRYTRPASTDSEDACFHGDHDTRVEYAEAKLAGSEYRGVSGEPLVGPTPDRLWSAEEGVLTPRNAVAPDFLAAHL